MSYQRGWLAHRIDQVKATLWQHQPLAAPPSYSASGFDYPDDPLWRSAKTGGLPQLLSPDELNAFSEVELLCGKIDIYSDTWRSAKNKRDQLEKQFPQLSNGEADFSKATPDDLRAYLSLLMAEMGTANTFKTWNNELIGAEETISSGNLNLEAIFAAEKITVSHKRTSYSATPSAGLP
jgi:hypothetical protein